MTTRIKAVGIRWNKRVYSVPRPGRHSDVIHWMASRGLGPECMHDQGFITEMGNFVNREEALVVATAANQILPGKGTQPKLFSEDVW